MIFGLDVSQWNRGVDLRRAKADGVEFFAARVMSAALKGDGVDRPKQIDPMWPEFRDLGRELWPDTFYCYIRLGAGQSARSQVDDFIRHNPDRSIPVMIDHEQGGGPLSLLHEVVALLVGEGYRMTPWAYLPDHWWERLGRPNLTGMNLWRSEYPGVKNRPWREQYAATRPAHWEGYGGGRTVGLQFSGSAVVGGFGPLCMNAFPGTREELVRALGYEKPPPPPPRPPVVTPPAAPRARPWWPLLIAWLRRPRTTTGGTNG